MLNEHTSWQLTRWRLLETVAFPADILHTVQVVCVLVLQGLCKPLLAKLKRAIDPLLRYAMSCGQLPGWTRVEGRSDRETPCELGA